LLNFVDEVLEHEVLIAIHDEKRKFCSKKIKLKNKTENSKRKHKSKIMFSNAQFGKKKIFYVFMLV
jgi:hypothetical protein